MNFYHNGCRERDIVRPPTPVQITPELPTVTVFYSRVARNLVGSREKQCGDDLNTAVGISLPLQRLSSQPYWTRTHILAEGMENPALSIAVSRLSDDNGVKL